MSEFGRFLLLSLAYYSVVAAIMLAVEHFRGRPSRNSWRQFERLRRAYQRGQL